jgi:phosphoglycerate dehydrogenase-like enzyme
MSTAALPLRILLSRRCAHALVPTLREALDDLLGAQPFEVVHDDNADGSAALGVDADVAFVSRDVTGRSTKHEWAPDTRRFYDAMRHAPSLRWLHVHSAGADRQIFLDLIARGVEVSTSSGVNAGVVVQTALAGLLSLSRRLPQLMAAQREHRWAPLIQTGMPPDLAGQTVVIVGWGPIGQQLGALLTLLGLNVVAVRRDIPSTRTPAITFITYAQLPSVLPRTDWLLLACPLTPQTEGLIDATALATLPRGAHLVNVARGEVADEPAVIAALQSGQLAGAYLDVFAHEPLPAESPLWDLPNVILTPHSAGFSDGNARRVETLFLRKLREWLATRQASTPPHG